MKPQTAAKTQPKLILPIRYDGKFTVDYDMSDGTSSAFRVMPELGQKIVRAVNAHEELVEALHNVLAHSELLAGDIREHAVQALAKAEGKE